MPVRVVARIRPQQNHEPSRDVIVSAHGNTDGSRPSVVKIPNPKNEAESYSFQFGSVYDETATQQDLYDNEIASSVKTLFNSTDVTIFAYGSTGTGKTHTMVGLPLVSFRLVRCASSSHKQDLAPSRIPMDD